MIKKHSHTLIPLQGYAFITLYAAIVVLLFVAGWQAMKLVFPRPGLHFALYIIFFVLAAALLGAWLWILIRLPQGMSRRFDEIKNGIAAGEIVSSDEFAQRLARFLVEYFSFFRFDVVAAVVQVRDYPPAHYPDLIHSRDINLQQLAAESRETATLINIGKMKVDNQELFGYLVPVWFGNDWLGYFCVFTDTRLNRLFRNMLSVFEDDFVDDQLMHVMYRDQRGQTQKICSSIDEIGHMIDSGEIGDTENYFERLLDLLLSHSHCAAGFIGGNDRAKTVYRNLSEANVKSLDVPAYDKFFHTGTPELQFALARQVNTEAPLAVIVLLDSRHTNINRAGNLLEDCLLFRIGKQVERIQAKEETK